MFNSILSKPNLAAATEIRMAGDLPLVRGRTISATLRATFGAGAPANINLNAYYSPDGRSWDTVPAATFPLVAVAGTMQQRTEVLGLPEWGYFYLAAENLDQAIAATNVEIWYSIQSFTPAQAPVTIIVPKSTKEFEDLLLKLGVTERGSILRDIGEER